MHTPPLSPGLNNIHPLPRDMANAFRATRGIAERWNDITPLARNEFICWVLDAKKPETRAKRITVAIDKLSRGERRPCCWIGCIHRTDKTISPSVRGILATRNRPS